MCKILGFGDVSPSRRVPPGKLALMVWAMFFVLVAPGFAQVEQGTISGTVRDTSGAVIVGAEIIIKNLATNQTFTLLTNDLGIYRSAPLRPGSYSVTAASPGFKQVVRSPLTLAIQQAAQVDLVLEVGERTDQVTVTGDLPLLQTREASRAELLRGERIVDLPLIGRNYLDLSLLTAGTNVGAAGGRGESFSTSGLRASHNSYILDGIDNQNYQMAGTGEQVEILRPSMDAIQEFKVQTNSYSAEFGGALGAVINVVTKSGENNFHGGVFEFLRNDYFASRNYFSSPDEPKPPHKRNQFGGYLGGPIFKDKTFFFANYEGDRRRSAGTGLVTVPTELERKGDFSQSIYAGSKVEIYDPSTYNASTNKRQPFLNNIIPSAKQDPVGVKLISLYPLPTLPGFVNNYISHPRNNTNANQFHVKIDHMLQKNSFSGRYSYSRSLKEGGIGGALPAPAYDATEDSMAFSNRAHSLVFTYGRMFSTTLFNSFRFGYNRLYTDRADPSGVDVNGQVGLKGTPPGFAEIRPTGYQAFGMYGVSRPLSTAMQIVNDASWIRGRHGIKWGMDLKFVNLPQYHSRYSKGRIYFDGRFTRQTSPRAGGHPIADLIVGTANRSIITTENNVESSRRIMGLYIQHDFQATSKFTINAGLRWEYWGNWVEKSNRFSNFDIDANPVNPSLVLAKDGNIRERSLLTPDYNNLAPRLGIAYRLLDKTVLRAGYGIFYGSADHYGDRYLGSGPPFHVTSDTTAGTIDPVLILRQGFPAGSVTANIQNLQTVSVQRNFQTSYSQQWNLTIQRTLWVNWSLEAAYVGTKGTKLLAVIDPNIPTTLAAGAINTRRPWKTLQVPGIPYPVTLADTYRRQWSGNSNYHALQTRLEKRFSQGLSFTTSYTFSKAIGDATGGEIAGSTSASRPQTPYNLRAERALADEDRRHRSVTSLNWNIPIGHGRYFLKNSHPVINGILGGWSLGGIITFNAGRPVHISTSGNPSNTGTADRPNRICDPNLPGSQRTEQRWFNTTCFVANAPYTFGNSSRNAVEGPGTKNIDLGIHKRFKPSESTSLQIRADISNALNNVNYGAPGGSLGTSSFGVIGSAGQARLVQFGLKFSF